MSPMSRSENPARPDRDDYDFGGFHGCVVMVPTTTSGQFGGVYVSEDPDSRWMTVCEGHGTVATQSSLRQARADARHLEFCEECIVGEPPREGAEQAARAIHREIAQRTAEGAAEGARQRRGAGRLDNPARTVRTATHFIGFCPVCTNRIKCQFERLVHHGYKRPGDGYIHGDCFGVGRTPHELSDSTAREYLDQEVLPQLGFAQFIVELLSAPEPVWPRDARVNSSLAGESMLSFRKLSTPDDMKYGRRNHILDDRGRPRLFPMTFAELVAQQEEGAPEWLQGDKAWARSTAKTEWERALHGRRHDAKFELSHWERERDRIRELIATWRLLPLQTVEDEIAQAREKKSVAAQRKIDDVTAKMAVVLASSQARLDSGVKNHNARTVESLFRDGYRKWEDLAQRINPRANRLDWLKAMDRDRVWAAFGLLVRGIYAEDRMYRFTPTPEYVEAFGMDRHGGPRDASDIMRPWGGWSDEPVAPWPEALGGGKTKK